MGASKEKTLDDEQRLLAMREHLNVRARPPDKVFEAEVVDAAIRKVQPLVDRNAHCQGEQIIASVARELGVQFEEVRSQADIQQLEKKYLEGQKELGFGLLAHELANPEVDALLFERINAIAGAPDQWVAVLNLLKTQSRAYWSRPHELIHRLAEPPQRRLPFYRHRTDARNRLERIIDMGAAELAFPRVAFGPRVMAVTNHDLTWEIVERTKMDFAPTSSLLSAAKAFIRFWPHPAFLLQASMRGRRGHPNKDIALRVSVEGFSATSQQSGVRFFPNMRVPPTSSIYHTLREGHSVSGFESLARWTTSDGEKLPDRRAFVCAKRLGPIVYGLVSLV
jgi:hypothetical protein